MTRAFFDNWTCRLRVKYDANQLSRQNVMNLLVLAGAYIGIGEGRPDSKNSASMGWGTFEVEYAADRLTRDDIENLLALAGTQVRIGECRRGAR